MSHAPASALASGLLAFALGMQRGRMRQAAYDAAVVEGRRQAAVNRRIRALENAARAARADATAARADAMMTLFLRRI